MYFEIPIWLAPAFVAIGLYVLAWSADRFIGGADAAARALGAGVSVDGGGRAIRTAVEVSVLRHVPRREFPLRFRRESKGIAVDVFMEVWWGMDVACSAA